VKHPESDALKCAVCLFSYQTQVVYILGALVTLACSILLLRGCLRGILGASCQSQPFIDFAADSSSFQAIARASVGFFFSLETVRSHQDSLRRLNFYESIGLHVFACFREAI
jgi:hypothetical protein